METPIARSIALMQFLVQFSPQLHQELRQSTQKSIFMRCYLGASNPSPQSPLKQLPSSVPSDPKFTPAVNSPNS